MLSRLTKGLLLRTLPRSLLVKRGPADAGAVYLTFDDGPNPQHTPPLLDLLAQHGAKASFFLVGEEVEKYGDVVRRIVDEGHRAGNHSWNHPVFGKLPVAEQMAQVERTDAALASYTGDARAPFRPPRGDLTPRLLARFARQARSIAYWSYDSLDYSRQSAAGLIDRLRGRPPVAGDIVLMHDDGGAALDILRALLPEWRARGLTFRALPREIC